MRKLLNLGPLDRPPVTPTIAIALTVLAVAPEATAADWTSYGHDLNNTRSQAQAGGVTAATAPKLTRRWARSGVAQPGGPNTSVTGTPAVAGNTVYYGDWTGHLVAADLRTGQLRWATQVAALPDTEVAGRLVGVTASPAVADDTVYVDTVEGHVVAVAARTGKIRWSTVVDSRRYPGVQASPVVAGDRLLVGVASSENFFAAPPFTFRGSIVALDRASGAILWRTFTLPADGDGRGGAIWSTAAVDRRRGLAYVGTGQGYAAPVGDLTDALLALRLDDGSIVWHRQFTANDVWNTFGGGFFGKDYDIGASPNLFRIGGRDVVGVGDKGGRYAALDRASGATVWRRVLCPGSHFGGVMTTAAVARSSIWATCNTIPPSAFQLTGHSLYFDTPGIQRRPAFTDIFRLDASSGRTAWRRRVPGVTFGAVTEAGGAVFVPNTDGTLRALDAASGRVLWTARPGAPMGGGAAVAGNTVLIGYGVQFGLLERSEHPPAGARGGIVAYAPRRYRPTRAVKQLPLTRVHGTWADPVGACVRHVSSFDPTTGAFTCTGTSVFTGTWVGKTTWTVTGRRDPASGVVTGQIHELFKGHARGGRYGTLTLVEQLNEDATGKEDNPAHIVRGSGGLAGSRGHVRFIGQSNPDGSGSGTYSGRWRPGK